MRFARAVFASTTLFLVPSVHAQEHLAAVDRIFAFTNPETPGCAVGVSQHGKVLITRAYGLGDVEHRVPLSMETRFDIGSTQKQFVAAAVLLLAKDGRLRLTDDVRTYLPALPQYRARVTIDHLLTHTSGVRDWTGLLPLAADGTDVLTLILRQGDLNFTPGDEWSYSNSGYVLLKEVVARASGQSFADFAERRLFAPLGMTATAYVEDILKGSGERALGYRRAGTAWEKSMRLGTERGGGAIISTVPDLLRWNDALTSGQLGSGVAEQLESRVRLNNGRTLTYARGLMVDSIPGGRMVSHSGSAAGYGTWLGRFTEHALSIATLCNFEPVSATTLAGRVADVFLPPVDPTTQPPGPVAVSGIDVSQRAGMYANTRTGDVMQLIVNGTRLAIAGGPTLIPVGPQRFQPLRTSLYFRSQDAFEITVDSGDKLIVTSMEGERATYLRLGPWTQDPSELKPLEGRYRSDDLDQELEVVLQADGLSVRFARSGEAPRRLQAIARDTFMDGPIVVRFQRNANSAVIGFDYSNPLIRQLRFARMEGRSTTAPN